MIFVGATFFLRSIVRCGLYFQFHMHKNFLYTGIHVSSSFVQSSVNIDDGVNGYIPIVSNNDSFCNCLISNRAVVDTSENDYDPII